MNLSLFKENDFLSAVKELFNELNVPINYIADEPTTAEELLKETYKDNTTFKLINDVFFVGMIDDAAFEGSKSLPADKIKSDYDGILIFAVTLNKRENNLLPTRSQLAEITRAFNREFYYTPVVLVFKYSDNENEYIAFANTERLKYKQEWREGEKAGKVSLLRDIDIQNPHTGHVKILEQLKITTYGAKAVNSFDKLYKYWQEVFNVNILSKKFFGELSNWYFWAINEVEFPDDAKKDRDKRNPISVIRLITRLMFVWFIKEKSLVPEQIFDKNHLDSLLNYNDVTGSAYYKAILQNLFFATLNTEMNKDKPNSRKFVNGQYLVHNLYRYGNLFNDKTEALKLFENIPFLNGGLFECLDRKDENDKVIRIDCFSENPKNQKRLKVPDYLFFGEEQIIDLSDAYGNKKKSKEKVRPIIDILNSYKFTIAENTPIEEEVALDPELLGKVFENLLASYNPETKTTARKQTGSFYTPREIVNYMVDESLIAYFITKLLPGSDNTNEKEKEKIEAKLRQLFEYNEQPHQFDNSEVDALINAIDGIKILDPAAGSGAFPMGILHRLVFLLHKLDPHNEKWKQKQIDKISEIEDPTVREQLLNDVEESFTNNELDYGRKLYLIENCIYGVDIQPVAVQIAKLRFFISLVVDQKVNPEKKNFGIRPLPNLETKFVAANTLIGLEKEENNLFTNPDIDKIKKQLKNVRHRYFTARTHKTKEKYRKKDKELRQKLSDLLTKEHYLQPEDAKMLAKWDPYDQNASAPFFDPEWMFGITDGFNVVIGNPPYIQLQKAFNGKQKYADLYKNENYKTFERTGDIYALFYEKGIDILNNNGSLCYITSNKWMRANYGKSLRKFFSENNPLKLIDLGPGIFDAATVDTNILLIQNIRTLAAKNISHEPANSSGKFTNKKLKALTLTDKSKLNNLSDKDFTILTYLSEQSWVILSPQEQIIKQQIEKVGTPLKDWDINIYRGVLTGFNEAFIINGKTKNELIAKDPKSAEIIKPILRGRDIKRYKAEFADLWLINTHNGYKDSEGNKIPPIDINDYPAIKEHLDNIERLRIEGYFGEKAKRAKGLFKRDDQGITPYNLRNCAYLEEFEKEKIVWKALSLKPSFCFISDLIFNNDKANILTSKSNNVNLKFLVSYFNSNLFLWQFSKYGINMGNGFEFKIQYINEIPIPKISKAKQKPFETLVDYILYLKDQTNGNLTARADNEHIALFIEDVIDGCVFELYFEDHMKEREINILEYVEQDLNQVMQGREFEQLTGTEKEEVIEKLHKKWTAPDSMVRSRIKLMPIKSPDIIKPILES